MVAADLRKALLVLLVSFISAAWGLWNGLAYWSTLSLLAVTWVAWTIWRKVEVNTTTPMMVATSLAAVLVLGLAGGPTTWSFLADIFAPVLLYSLTIGTIAPTLGASKACGPRTMALMAFLATVAAGCIVLLALYYLDALLSTTYLNGNSDLMWPLSIILLGALLISTVVHVSGLEEVIWESKEVSG